MVRAITLLALLCAAAAPAAQTETKKDDLTPEAAKAKKAVEEFLAKHKATGGARVAVINDTDELGKLFKDHHFVSVHFPEWPIARVPGEMLKSRNVFVIGKDDKVLHLTDAKGLEDFFKENLPAFQVKQPLRPAVQAWLRLSQEFVQDGYYKFEFDKGQGFGAGGMGMHMEGGVLNVVPDGGNKGKLTAEIWVDDTTGKVTKVVEKNEVVRGIRPKCQATRLLDADPVIREICEQDLLVMGQAAYGYLMEQRAKASPELQREIDRVWRKILDEGR